MSRLASTFERLRADGRTGLVTYATAGDPTLARSADILVALDRAGADVLEIGVPFSDPFADGPVIQRASQRALAAGATLAGVIDLVGRIRADIAAPVVLFTYANPVFRLGLSAFTDRARGAGVDAVLVLDLPVEEASDLHAKVTAADLDMIFLVSPTTTDARLARTATFAGGFIYAISRLGVTGARPDVAAGCSEMVRRVRQHIHLPVAVGFGISHPDHVRAVGLSADAAVVGSSLVQVIADAGSGVDLIARVQAHVTWLRQGCGRPQTQ
jgi:tryptophan synthase alpha chain